METFLVFFMNNKVLVIKSTQPLNVVETSAKLTKFNAVLQNIQTH